MQGQKRRSRRYYCKPWAHKRSSWPPGTKAADVTDYHIDAPVRFVKQGQVLIQIGNEIDPDDPWSVAAFETQDIPAQATDAEGRKLELVILPEPYDIRIGSPDWRSPMASYLENHMPYLCSQGICNGQSPDIRELVAELALSCGAKVKCG